ncbi:undecaprenyl diphosphate synthase family protein, partial [Mycobacterium tuberculosis]
MEIIPPRLKEPLYRLYELRLRQGLAASKSDLPRHIAVLCDGNRRWARSAGYDDVSYGYRMGAAKIAEMLRWCHEAGIELATVYLLSTENLQRDPDELAALIEIITDVVEEICALKRRTKNAKAFHDKCENPFPPIDETVKHPNDQLERKYK